MHATVQIIMHSYEMQWRKYQEKETVCIGKKVQTGFFGAQNPLIF